MPSLPSGPAREPVFNLPGVVLSTILVLIGAHGLREWILSDRADLLLLLEGAVIPVRWTAAFAGWSVDRILAELAAADSQASQVAQYVLSEGDAKPWTGLTYALIHGSWGHVLMNSVWLAAFGTPVARRCGGWRFFALAAAAAVGGAVAHVLVHPFQVYPMVGASAAISGMMAAATWFLFAEPVWRLDGRLAEPHERPRGDLAATLGNRRVLGFLAVWFATNYLFAILARPLGITDASIAWEAHLGGFIVGLVLFPWLDPIPSRPQPRRV